jgi:monoamine oxidase
MARTRLFSQLRRIAQQVRFLSTEQSSLEREQAAAARRRFLRDATGIVGSLAGGTSTVLSAGTSALLSAGCDGARAPSKRVVENQGRIAIIGAGLAGLHCAYRLGQAGVTVKVFESSSRIGGRTFTDREHFAPQVAELGGEFIDSNHVTMQTLASELGITLDDRHADLDAATVADTWWIAGAKVPEMTIVQQFTEVAPLMHQLMEQADADDEKFAELDEMSLADWLTEHVPPAQFAELHAVLFAAYRGEYGLEPEQQSVLNLLYLIGADDPDPFRIFGESDERFHTHQGSQTFCERLHQEWQGEVQLATRLVSARLSGEVVFALGFEQQGRRFEEEFDHVVFALPFSTLREVALTGLRLPEDKLMMIGELGYGTNAKVLGRFSQRVWRHAHDSSGSVTSDSALQQCWDSSPGQPGNQGVLTNFLGGTQGVASAQGSAEDWYTHAIDQVEPIFPGTRAAYVTGSAVRMHWPTYPHSKGSYACYRPGQWSFWSTEGERVGNLHFCGEHTSLDFQGYMEGAAETGARAAGEILETLQVTPSAVHQGLLALWHDLPRRALGARRPAVLERKRALQGRIHALLELRRADRAES